MGNKRLIEKDSIASIRRIGSTFNFNETGGIAGDKCGQINIVNDINEGADDTDIRSGIIGEIGCTWPPKQNEIKVLRASGKAQKVTGAPILIHPGRNENAP